jgi:hypothetical protein
MSSPRARPDVAAGARALRLVPRLRKRAGLRRFGTIAAVAWA